MVCARPAHLNGMPAQQYTSPSCTSTGRGVEPIPTGNMRVVFECGEPAQTTRARFLQPRSEFETRQTAVRRTTCRRVKVVSPMRRRTFSRTAHRKSARLSFERAATLLGGLRREVRSVKRAARSDSRRN